MGRKKGYDRDVLVGKAMEIFRDHGFAGTSAEMLVEGLGVNRYSLYAEFGSKQGLFDAALERYDADVVERSFGPLEAPGAGIEEVRALLEFCGSAGDNPGLGRGCNPDPERRPHPARPELRSTPGRRRSGYAVACPGRARRARSPAANSRRQSPLLPSLRAPAERAPTPRRQCNA